MFEQGGGGGGGGECKRESLQILDFQRLASLNMNGAVITCEQAKAHSHLSLNMFKSCSVKQGWNFFSFIKAAYWLEFVVDLVQITKHVKFPLNPV